MNDGRTSYHNRPVAASLSGSPYPADPCVTRRLAVNQASPMHATGGDLDGFIDPEIADREQCQPRKDERKACPLSNRQVRFLQ
jgi:hypothetical protein